jgi:hypothetical protein
MDFPIFSVRTYELFKEASSRMAFLPAVPKEETPMLKMYHWPT